MNATDNILRLDHKLYTESNGAILFKWQNVSHSSPSIDDTEQSFLNHLTICIGVQKGGTTSVMDLLRISSDIVGIHKEFHYFDKRIFEKDRQQKHKSFQSILTYIYSNNLSSRSYIQQLADFNNIDMDHFDISKHWIFEKTPEYSITASAAYLIANDFIQYGTKIIVFLRNPMKRMISGYYESRKWYTEHADKSNSIVNIIDSRIEEYIGNITWDVNVISFKNMLNGIYNIYSRLNSENKSTALIEIVDIYHKMSHLRIALPPSQRASFQLWFRSCYAPQILTWIYYIRQMNKLSKYKHSFKIIQSEMYYNKQTYHETVKYLLCYIHYNIHNDNYNQWMTDCVEKDIYNGANTTERKINSKTPHDLPLTTQQIDQLSDSLLICNKWLKVVIDLYSKHILLNGFNLDIF